MRKVYSIFQHKGWVGMQKFLFKAMNIFRIRSNKAFVSSFNPEIEPRDIIGFNTVASNNLVDFATDGFITKFRRIGIKIYAVLLTGAMSGTGGC